MNFEKLTKSAKETEKQWAEIKKMLIAQMSASHRTRYQRLAREIFNEQLRNKERTIRNS